MDNFRIRGGNPLVGTIRVSGAKNAALPIMTTALLADGEHCFRNVPQLMDVRTMGALLESMGLGVKAAGNTVEITGRAVNEPVAPYELVKKMRASVLVLGPLVARYGRAKVSLPGGCAIGARPIDQHLKGLEAMGAEVTLEHGYVSVEVPKGRLDGAEIVLDMPTVTGTENLMAAAVLARGRTTLVNAAREPEVEEMARVLNKMGARIDGAGTDVIHIEGVEGLEPVDHAIIADRIEASTYMAAVAATRGDALLTGVTFEHLEAVAAKMRRAGVIVEREANGIRIAAQGPLKAVGATTAPHPGFPTDMQAQHMVLMAMAEGQCTITETIFENRFMHVPELNRMGAEIDVRGRVATVKGVKKLSGATVMATDLRASASLVIAGLIAEGETELLRVYHIDRGYERIEEKLNAVGAQIERVAGGL